MNSKRVDEAVVIGYDEADQPVFEQVLDLHEYWDEAHPVINDDQFRERKKIRRLVGRLCGSAGQLLQEFKNTFDDKGELRTSHARHADGTETTFPPKDA